MTGTVRYEVSDGVATITLNRPEAMNGLDVATKEALLDAVREAAEDDAVRCVVLTGSGRAFCVGQDLKEHITILESSDAESLFTHRRGALQPDRHRARHDAQAGGRRRQRRRRRCRRQPRVRLRLPGAHRGRRLQPRLHRRRAVLRHRLVVDPARGSSAGPRRWSCSTSRARSARPSRSSSGWPPRSSPPTSSRARSPTLARRLADGPTVSYGAIRRSVEFSAGHDFAESLAFEASMMTLTGDTEDHRNAVARVREQGEAGLHGPLTRSVSGGRRRPAAGRWARCCVACLRLRPRPYSTVTATPGKLALNHSVMVPWQTPAQLNDFTGRRRPRCRRRTNAEPSPHGAADAVQRLVEADHVVRPDLRAGTPSPPWSPARRPARGPELVAPPRRFQWRG